MPIELRKATFERNGDTIELNVSQYGFKVVHIATQNNIPTIWYETVVDPIISKDVKFKLLRSNTNIPENSHHVGSVHVDYEEWGSEVVWHVYQL